MFEIVPPNTKFDFIGWRRPAALVSLAMVAVSLGLIMIVGPNFGIDFAGGSLVHLRFAEAKKTDEVRAALSKSGLTTVDIQDVGGHEKEFLIRVPLTTDDSAKNTELVASTLKQTFANDKADVLRIETVGPRVGELLREKAILAVLLATLMMGVYIWVRFEWRYGVGTGAAILHDVIIVLGFLVAFGYEFDLNIVASLLAVVGLSVNDKVVVSDRIRESRAKDHKSPLAVVINKSINETLSRTILTNGTAFFAVLSLFIFGGSVLHGFAFALVVGSIIGTYSSIYIASSIVLFFETAKGPGTKSAAVATRKTSAA